MGTTTRFGLTNRINTGCTLMNGTGGGAPATDDDGTHLMDNVLQGDRNVVWISSASPSYPITIDIDLGATRTIDAVGLHGLIGFWTLCTVYKQTGTYSPGGTWTAIAVPSVAGGPRDTGYVFDSTTARSLRFEIQGSGQIGCGKFFAGTLTDLGLVGSPGYENSPRANRAMLQFPSGAVFLQSLGYKSREIGIPIGQASTSLAATVQQLADQAGPFILVDLNDTFYDVVLVNDGKVGVIYSSATRRELAVQLVALP